MKSLEDYLYPILSIYNKSPKNFQWLIAKLYNIIPEKKRLGPAIYRYEKLIKESEFLSKEDLFNYQEKHFLKTIEIAKKTKFYPGFYQKYGININDIKSLDDINKLPFLTKEHLQEEKKNLIDISRENEALYITTGGSSGTPTGLYYEKGITRAKEQAFIEAIWAQAGYKRGDKSASLRGKITGRGNEQSLSKLDYVRNWLHLSSYHLTESNLHIYIKELNRFKPKFIQGYPSALSLLAKLMIRNKINLDFKVQGIFAGSENISTEQIELIEKALNARLITWYGHSEVAVLGGFCSESNRYHIFPQYGYTEIVNNENEVISQGKGEIVGTNFHNSIFPLIRFKTGDIAEIDPSQNCICNRNYLYLSKIHGREHEFIVADNNRLISLTAINMHDKTFDNVKQYQFIQSEPAKIDFHYTCIDKSKEIDSEKINKKLAEKIGNKTEIRIKKVDKIELSKRGKAVALIQNINIDQLV